MKRREELLAQHTYEIWKGKDDSWNTYLPTVNGGRKQLKKKRKEDIDDVCISEFILRLLQKNAFHFVR